MVLKVHGLSMSNCTARVLLTIREKGAEYELIPVNLIAGEQKKPEFLALQPFGQVPVLQDGELKIFESRAIARYVCEKYSSQGTALYGKTLQEKALVEQWLEVEAQEFHPYISKLTFELFFSKLVKGLKQNQAVIEENLEKLDAVLQVYEKHLEKNEYLANNSFSLADLCHVPYMHSLVNLTDKGSVITSKPNVNEWWKRISSRPAWQEIVAVAKA